MIDITLKITGEQLKRAQQLLRAYPVRMPMLMADVLNRAIAKARTETVSAVTARYQIKAGDVRTTLHLVHATRNRLIARLSSKGARIPLYQFTVIPRGIKRPTRPKAGLKVGVLRGSRKPMMHAFVEEMKSGHIGVFTRRGTGRFPIEEKFSPDVPSMVGYKTVIDRIEAQAVAMYEKRLDHAISQLEASL